MERILKKYKDNDVGDVVLDEEPLITATPEEVEDRLKSKDEQTGFWKNTIKKWEDEGLI